MSKQRINKEAIEKIELGEYTYKQLCDLGIFIDGAKTGNTKRAQITDLEQYFDIDYKSKKRKIIVIDKKEKFDKKVFTRIRKLKIYPNFDVPKEKWECRGVYIIIDKDNNCYIGSTTSGFRNRFLGHYQNKITKMQHTYNLLHENNAKFKILEDMTGINEDTIRERENYYLQLYRKNDKYNVINGRNYVCGFAPDKEKTYRTIKIDNEYYDKVIKLLKENGFLK